MAVHAFLSFSCDNSYLIKAERDRAQDLARKPWFPANSYLRSSNHCTNLPNSSSVSISHCAFANFLGGYGSIWWSSEEKVTSHKTSPNLSNESPYQKLLTCTRGSLWQQVSFVSKRIWKMQLNFCSPAVLDFALPLSGSPWRASGWLWAWAAHPSSTGGRTPRNLCKAPQEQLYVSPPEARKFQFIVISC